MSVYSGPEIANNGLVLHLDAANPRSYPGTGTVWNDLSGNGNNGALINTVGYSATNKGNMIFNGVNDHIIVSSNVSIPYGSSARTVSIWFYTNSTSWADNVNNLFYYGAGSTGNAFGIDMNPYPNMEVYTWGGANRDLIFSTTYSQVGWKNISVTYDGATTVLVYENGIFTQTLTLASACTTPSSSVYIGSVNPAQFAGYFNGNIAHTSIYNRALTAIEVKQNFEALRGRYNI